jgi:putative glutamine amidotransferase
MTKTSPPRVGLTLDAESPGGYSAYAWYALRANYAAAVAAAGGTPLCLPHLPAQAAAMLDAIDALIVTGGAFDIAPDLYGDTARHPTVTLKQARTEAEFLLIRGALARGLPMLGICGGEQLLAVALGGTLIQHIPDSVPGALPHEQPNPRHEAGHMIRIAPGTRLHGIVQADTMAVNSSHHQAVRTPGRAAVNATAADGVIEGIEDPSHPFCIGVQWHPEFAIDPGDARLFSALIEAAS